jgi:G:T-mismatch repair DNA endonuclease (very short patch repair protein)
MSRIRGKNTTPEMVVRSLLHKMGYRFRLHPNCIERFTKGYPQIQLHGNE